MSKISLNYAAEAITQTLLLCLYRKEIKFLFTEGFISTWHLWTCLLLYFWIKEHEITNGKQKWTKEPP